MFTDDWVSSWVNFVWVKDGYDLEPISRISTPWLATERYRLKRKYFKQSVELRDYEIREIQSIYFINDQITLRIGPSRRDREVSTCVCCGSYPEYSDFVGHKCRDCGFYPISSDSECGPVPVEKARENWEESIKTWSGKLDEYCDSESERFEYIRKSILGLRSAFGR